MRATLAGVDETTRRSLSKRISDHLADLEPLRPGARVAWYASLPDEVATDAILEERWQRGVPVWLPRMRSDGALDFVRVRRPEDLRPLRYGVREPLPALASTPLEALDAVAVPGLAFDRSGLRLGRGGGFYDRTFPPLGGAGKRPITVGVAFSFQIVEALPRAEHDLRVDTLVTERGVKDPR